MNSKHKFLGPQGYLLEVPIAVFLAVTAGLILLPLLPKTTGKVVLILLTLIVLPGLYYMVVTPGWRPWAKSWLGRTGRLIVFLVLALVILAVVGVLLIA